MQVCTTRFISGCTQIGPLCEASPNFILRIVYCRGVKYKAKGPELDPEESHFAHWTALEEVKEEINSSC